MKPYARQNGREVKWVNGWFRTRTEAKAAGDGCEPVKMVELLKGDVILSAAESEELQDLVWKLGRGRVRALQLARGE